MFSIEGSKEKIPSNGVNLLSLSREINFVSDEWENVPPVVKTTLEKIYSLFQTQSKSLGQIPEINSKINKIQKQLDNKISKETFEHVETDLLLLKDQIEKKANKDLVINALHKKANKNNLEELQEQMKLNEVYSEEFAQFKIDNSNILNNLNSKIKTIDSDVDQLVADVKKKFETFNKFINEFNNETKLDKKFLNDFEKNFEDKLMETTNQNNQSILEKFSKFRTEMLLFTQGLLEDIKKQRTLQNSSQNYDTQLFDLQSLYNELQDNFQKFSNQCISNNLYPSQNNNIINEMTNDIKQIKLELNNKVSIPFFTEILQTKVDHNTFKSLMNSKITCDDFENRLVMTKAEIKSDLAKMNDDINTRVTGLDFQNKLAEVHSIMTALKDSLIMKVDIKELKQYLNAIATHSDLDKIVKILTDRIDLKLSSDIYHSYINKQNNINNIVFQENAMAKYLWDDNQFTNCCIHFNVERTNTCPDLFYAEKDSNYMIVREHGAYLVKFILFIEKEDSGLLETQATNSSFPNPIIRILVDNKSVVTDFYGIGETERKGNMTLSRILYDNSNESSRDNKYCVGYNYVEYLKLNEKSRLAISITPCSDIVQAKGIFVIKTI